MAAGGIAAAVALSATAAQAQDFGAPVPIGEGVTLDPIFAARERYETVDQDTIAAGADAVTARERAGLDLKDSGFAIPGEVESTLADVCDYNDTIPGNWTEPSPAAPVTETNEPKLLQEGDLS